ncbi:hypothetical protein BDA99DRAFT_535761 [Phascolomyces articulosus]|uniref:F-box domain-containing protein n=1 Tax=Phascolomyces articulosus TaxID=60185 RepID=A0AAD5PFH7_9FUNG|nr:hypothetical protein BDA99DRAFT_535761 [Phascolomyces articulosus]
MFQNVYTTVRSVLKSSFEHPNSCSASTSLQQTTNEDDRQKYQRQRRLLLEEAEKQIHKSPTSADGYLAAGKLLQEENRLDFAFQIYKQGLQSVLLENNPEQYALLQKEERKLSNTLLQQKQIEDGKKIDFLVDPLLPYDLVCLILEQLQFADLLQCSSVSQAWCHFVLDWPEFWYRASRNMPPRVPYLVRKIDYKSVLDPLLRPHGALEQEEIQFNGALPTDLICDILLLFAHSGRLFTKKLIFSNLYIMEHDVATDLGYAIQKSFSISDNYNNTCSSRMGIKQVHFIDCRVPSESMFGTLITSSCHSSKKNNVTHISFSQNVDRPTVNKVYVHLPSKQQIIIPETQLSTLSYLKLSGPYPGASGLCESYTGRLIGILRQCPNLAHLFLDSYMSLHYGYIIDQALTYCPHLENVILSDRANMPLTIMSDIGEKEFDKKEVTTTINSTVPLTKRTSKWFNSKEKHQTITRTKDLRRLVIDRPDTILEHDMFINTFRKCYASLELLYLSCALEHTNGNTNSSYSYSYNHSNNRGDNSYLKMQQQQSKLSFHKLSSFGVLYRLRELDLSLTVMNSSKSQQENSKALASLLAQCPALHVIRINSQEQGNFEMGLPFLTRLEPHSPVVNDQVLETIATHCPLVTHLHVFGKRAHSPQGILRFSELLMGVDSDESSSSSQQQQQQEPAVFVDMVMDIDKEMLLRVVKNLKGLKHLCLFNENYNGNYALSDHEENVESVLTHRGGSLRFEQLKPQFENV